MQSLQVHDEGLGRTQALRTREKSVPNKKRATEQTNDKALMTMQDDAVKSIVVEIAEQTMFTEQVSEDMLTDSELIETIATTVNAGVKSTMDQKLTTNSVKKTVEDLVPAKQFIEGVTKALLDNPVTLDEIVYENKHTGRRDRWPCIDLE